MEKGRLSFVAATIGHVICVIVLVSASLVVSIIEGLARICVGVVAYLTGATIEQDSLDPHRERVETFQRDPALVKYKPDTGADGGEGPDQVIKTACHAASQRTAQVIDQEATLKRTQGLFPIAAEDLISRAHIMIKYEFGGRKPEESHSPATNT